MLSDMLQVLVERHYSLHGGYHGRVEVLAGIVVDSLQCANFYSNNFRYSP